MKTPKASLFVASLLLACLPFRAAEPKVATPADQIKVPPGFRIELVRSAATNEGSWISVCKDAKGRLIISPQDGRQGLFRMTLAGPGRDPAIEKIDLKVGAAMGLLEAFGSLYVSGNGPQGLGLYRLKDTNGDDHYDSVEMLKKFQGAEGEHGSHALLLARDSKIYYLHGNFVKVPPDLSPASPHKNYADDVLLPRGEDGNGFGRGLKPPGSYVARCDQDGKNWELVAAGLRNAYDFAFNQDGELFTFDSDMEWDWSMPWYRPTRIYHVVSGGEYGFREGTAKWPAHYPDGLPPTLDAGIGSPTGVVFGHGAKFPARYQNALYAMDWSYGRIFAVHLTPEGASYSATKEEFVKGKPLNVTDMVIGDDGALYFMTGGRGTQSGLYRVSYSGVDSVAPAVKNDAGAESRALRRKLESFHGHKDPKAVDFVWPHLGSDDRWIRFAARIALEHQDVGAWSARALAEQNPEIGLSALLALARSGSAEVETDLINALGRLCEERVSPRQLLDAARVLQVAMIRMGRPDSETCAGIIESVDAMFPSGNAMLDRELSQILIYLNAPSAVEKTLALARAASTFEDQAHYMFSLRSLKTGWTHAQREEYFAWFNLKHGGAGSKHAPQTVAWFTEAGRDYSDGASFPKFLANARADAIATLTDEEKGSLGLAITGQQPVPKAPTAPVRAFVKDWKTADIAESLHLVSQGRNFKRGKEAFAAAQCYVCHRFGNEGGSIGPEMTTVSTRFTRRDILESILEPSKVVSEQYQGTDFTLKDGGEVSGRIIEENEQRYIVLTNPLANGRTEVRKSDVAKRTPARMSTMPEGLASVLTKTEILDMIAFIESAGKESSPLFQK